MQGDDFTADGEAESGTAGAVTGTTALDELLENGFFLAGRNAGAGIADGEARPAIDGEASARPNVVGCQLTMTAEP